MGQDATTDLATQSVLLADGFGVDPGAQPTEIVLPTPTVAVLAELLPTELLPTAVPPTVTAVPAAVLVEAPEADPPATATAEPTVASKPEVAIVSSAAAEASPTATEVPPTAEPTAEPTPTLEPTPEPTAEPIPEPTPEPTAEPAPTATVEPAASAAPTLEVEPAWMYVVSTDGLFLRDEPAGQITSVLTYRSEVHVTGHVVQSGDHQWIEVDVPQSGWVALSFLTMDQPAPASAPTTPSTPTEPPSASDWAAFRNCESGGRYDAVDPSGLYHGAYQFLPSTWDGLARRFWPDLVGVLPSTALPQDQDKMAAKLFELEGVRPWPTCGRHLL